MNCPEVYNNVLCAMNRDLSGEEHEVNPPGSTSISDGRNGVGPGGSPADKEFGPDFIVAVKVESEFLDQSSSLDKDSIVKVKVESEFEDEATSQEKDEAQVVKSQTFQNDLLHTSQDALSNDHVKQETCDSPPTEPSKAAQLLEEKQMNLVSCSNCSQLLNTHVFNHCMTQTVTQETGAFSTVSCKRCTEIPKNIQGSQRPHRCSVCGKSFTTLSSLKRHQTIHTYEKPFRCSICNKEFARSSHLHDHQRTHTGEKPYKCSLCLKAFAHSTSLKKHIRIHTGEKPFKCSLCAKAFIQSSHLRNHQKIHRGEKPCKCYLCPAAFADLISLKNHLRIHPGEQPHKCSVCSKSYAFISGLKIHQRVHTGEKLFQCTLCSKEFVCSSDLHVHYRTHTREIPSSVDTAKKALCPDMALKLKKEKSPLLIEVSVPNDFGLNSAEIRKMTKHQDLKNEVKRTWKLKKAEIVPVKVGATGMIKKSLTECLRIIPGNIMTNELQVEAVRFSEYFENSPWNEVLRTLRVPTQNKTNCEVIALPKKQNESYKPNCCAGIPI